MVLNPFSKVELPIAPVKKGYGFDGVVIRDKERDELQCHICGKFFKGLSKHISMAHGKTSREYKKEYGLPLTFPLVAKSTSALLSEQAIENSGNYNLTPIEASVKAKESRDKNVGKYREYYRNNASFHNKRGICDLQINSRYLVVCFIVGKLASESNLNTYDSPLRSRIIRRYESFDNYIKIIGQELYDNKKEGCMESVIAILRDFYHSNGELPKLKDFGVVTQDKILKMFGSFESSLVHSGFERMKVEI